MHTDSINMDWHAATMGRHRKQVEQHANRCNRNTGYRAIADSPECDTYRSDQKHSWDVNPKDQTDLWNGCDK